MLPFENTAAQVTSATGKSVGESTERYGYVPEILRKLAFTFQRYSEAYPELKPIKWQMQPLLESTARDSDARYASLLSLMQILRNARTQSRCAQLLYLRVLGDVAHAQGKSIPRYAGEDYLGLLL
jgi:hypothetical protein